ncbi:hypothetical protein NP493_437g01019 [Ridgeia piscesae]|uniref:Uncharacterized protein n=1 Tax=Ridgeia piscesae TaxID=27915 RepID=A0AAD9L193_RIDPI|nr:hypothetical protein NP493_437g01019 [Ridgeia piscesae]
MRSKKKTRGRYQDVWTFAFLISSTIGLIVVIFTFFLSEIMCFFVLIGHLHGWEVPAEVTIFAVVIVVFSTGEVITYVWFLATCVTAILANNNEDQTIECPTLPVKTSKIIGCIHWGNAFGLTMFATTGFMLYEPFLAFGVMNLVVFVTSVTAGACAFVAANTKKTSAVVLGFFSIAIVIEQMCMSLWSIVICRKAHRARTASTEDSVEQPAGNAKRHRQSSKNQPRHMEQQSEYPLRERGDRPLDYESNAGFDGDNIRYQGLADRNARGAQVYQDRYQNLNERHTGDLPMYQGMYTTPGDRGEPTAPSTYQELDP